MTLIFFGLNCSWAKFQRCFNFQRFNLERPNLKFNQICETSCEHVKRTSSWIYCTISRVHSYRGRVVGAFKLRCWSGPGSSLNPMFRNGFWKLTAPGFHSPASGSVAILSDCAWRKTLTVTIQIENLHLKYVDHDREVRWMWCLSSIWRPGIGISKCRKWESRVSSALQV